MSIGKARIGEQIRDVFLDIRRLAFERRIDALMGNDGATLQAQHRAQLALFLRELFGVVDADVVVEKDDRRHALVIPQAPFRSKKYHK